MIRMSCSYPLKKNQKITGAQCNKKIDFSLSGTHMCDQQIIEINNILLTPGFHSIRVDSIGSGRNLLNVFLPSLNCYHAIGCLTMGGVSPEHVQNIYTMLQEGSYLDAYSPDDFDHFFTELFYFDFLWIEESHTLMCQPWVGIFKEKIKELGIHKNISIISFTYRDEIAGNADKAYYVKN